MDFSEILKILGVGGNALTIIVAAVTWTLHREKQVVEAKFDDLKAWVRNINSKVDVLEKETWTKMEQAQYRDELAKRLDRLESKIDRLLEGSKPHGDS